MSVCEEKTESKATFKRQLRHCLETLKNASSDNEKFAGLLVFTHLIKTNADVNVDENELMQSIDMNFLVRLLNSTNVPQGCPEFVYKSLALNILSSFSQYDVLSHSALLSNLGRILDVLTKNQADNHQMLKDAVSIILIFSRNVEGSKNLLKSKCIPIICKRIMENPETENLFEIIKGVLLHCPQLSWDENQTEFLEYLTFLSTEFSMNQNLLKFESCKKILVLLSSLDAIQEETAARYVDSFSFKSKTEIRDGISDILKSRCKVKFKYIAVQLARVMVELFGLEWTIPYVNESLLVNLTDAKFLLVVLAVTSTEIHIIFENNQLNSEPDFVISCYIIIEKMIEFLISDNKQSWSFSDEVIRSIHSMLTSVFDYLIQFLIGLDSQNPEDNTPKTPIVMATIRVLCMWLSEETSTLGERIAEVLPILIKWAKYDQVYSSKDNSQETEKLSNEILLYLLPPLCHFSAEENFSMILINEDYPLLLGKLFINLWQVQLEKENYPNHLITLCNIFMNWSVLEVEMVKQDKIFGEISMCIQTALPQLINLVSIELTAHFILLGLFLFRHRHTLSKLSDTEKHFITSCINGLKMFQAQATSNDINAHALWKTISELWFLSIQNIVACAKTIEPVKTLIIISLWPKDIEVWLDSCDTNNSDVFKELRSALLPIAQLK